MTKVCEFCGKRFEAIRPTKRFCSKSCVNRHLRTGCKTIEEARKRPRVTFEIVCVFCGKKFTAKNHYAKYCSRLCYLRGYKSGYGCLAEFEAAQRKRKELSRQRVQKYGITDAEKLEVIKAQDCGSREKLWRASQKWSVAQRLFAQRRWEERFMVSPLERGHRES